MRKSSLSKLAQNSNKVENKLTFPQTKTAE